MQQQRIARLLPAVFQRTLPDAFWQTMAADADDTDLVRDFELARSPLAAFLALMEALHAPAEAALAELERYFHPYDAPEAFVYYLASWLALEPLFLDHAGDDEYFFAGGMGRLRELVAAAVALSGRRGTHTGLTQFLEIATGVQGFTIDEDAHVPFHVVVRYPPPAGVFVPLLHRIIRLEKPAYVTYDLLPREAASATEEEE